MDEKKFLELLTKNGLNPEQVCFNDSVKDDVFCVMENYARVEVFYRERGRRFEEKIFRNKTEALEYLLNRLLKLHGKQTEYYFIQ